METDAELLARWRNADKAAGNELLARYFGSVRRFFASKITGADVEDLVQRTFSGCVVATETFRGDASFRTFLLAIARKQLYKYIRDRYRKQAREDPDLGVSSVTALGQSPSSVFAAKEREALVLQALQRVSVEHQTMLELHYWESMPAAEIAEVVDLQPGAVRTRLHRARKALQRALEELSAGSPDIDIDVIAREIGARV